MKRSIAVQLNPRWVLEHRADPVKPLDGIEKFLLATFGEQITVQDKTLTRIVAIVDDEQISEETFAQALAAHMGKTYGMVFPTSNVMIRNTAYAPESEEAASETTTENAQENTKACLAEINRIIGGDEFKSLACEIATIAPTVVAEETAEIFTYQSYLFSINDGYGLSTYLSALAKLVAVSGIRKINWTDDVVEMVIPAGKGEGNEAFETATEFLRGRSFGGTKLVCFDIREWMNKLHSRPFKEFLSAVENALKHIIVVFRIPFVDKEVLEQVRYALNDLIYVRSVSFPPYNQAELQQCAVAELDRYGFKMSKTAWECFHERLAEERSDGRFYGMNTVKKVVRELLYKKQLSNAKKGKKDTLISRKDAQAICKNDADLGISGYEMLDKMVGGEAIRGRLEEIISQIELANQDKSMATPCIHMRFVGNPGTGKTTVARIVGKILKEKGILRVGSFFEYAGRDFCGRYIGETAPKTSSICRDAYGSVLFIDEAYTLYRGEDNPRDFGKEVLDTLIAEMENHRSDFVVIMAGYTDEMNQLMKGNAGLASRMPYVIEFPNFTREQLFAIYHSMIEGKFGYSDDLLPAVKAYFDSLPDAFLSSKEFSNGRFVRNLFERTWAKAAMRCQLAKIATVTLTKDDFMRSIADSEFKINAVNKKRSIGFIES